MRSAIIYIFLVTLSVSGYAQEKWNLKTVVQYAMDHNIQVRLNEVQAQNAALTYKQSRLSQIPSANFNGNTGINSGSNQDPTTFDRITQTYLSAGLQLQSSVDVFNFFSKRNTIEANKWEVEAAKANVDKLKNDIALTAANSYLQILLAKEQVKITEVQLKQTSAQLSNTRKMVDAGSLPELNATQLEAQLANDSVNYITAKGTVTQNILQLKKAMNIAADAPFEIEEPAVSSIPTEPIADLQPDYVYGLAMINQPQQKYNILKIKAADKAVAASKGAMYPTISLFGSLGSNYNNKAQTILSSTPVLVPIGSVDVGGTQYTVFPNQPFNNYTYGKTAFTDQLQNNFRQSVGLGLNIPLFNGASLRTNYERSKLNVVSLNIQKEQHDNNLKQDIYLAYSNAVIALEKFNASRKSVLSNEKAYEFASKRYEVGMLGTYDLISTQNNLLRAKLEYSLNEFDYVFKMKVLEFYKGLGLKL